MYFKPFITGSFAYGSPDDDSDIDLVVFMTKEIVDFLLTKRDPGRRSIHFGKLNIIPVISEAEYLVWLDGTRELSLRRPVTTEEATAVLDRLRSERGVKIPDWWLKTI